jgi:hypothetical protein
MMNLTINSGMAYLISLVAVIGYAFYIHAPFSEFWIAVGSLYGWHTGRRLWRQLKMGTAEITNGNGGTVNTPSAIPEK